MARRKIVPPEIASVRKLSIRYFDFDSTDWWMNGVIAIATLTAWELYSFWWEALAVLLVGACAMYRLDYGRVYSVVYDEIQNAKIEKLQKGKFSGDTIPIIVDELIDEKGNSIGLMRTKADDSYSVLIIGTGSSIVTKDEKQQYRAYMNLAHRLRRLPKNVGFSWVFRVSPADPWPVADFYNAALNPFVAVPEGIVKRNGVFEIPDDQLTRRQKRHMFLHKVAGAVQEQDRTVSRDVTMAMVLTVIGNRELIKSKGNVGQNVARKTPALRLARNMAKDLRNWGVADAHIADAKETLRYVRTTWDSVDAVEYYDAEQSGEAGFVEQDSTQKQSHLPPKGALSQRSRIRIGNTWLGALRVTAQPEAVTPTFMLDALRLLDSDGQPINGTFALVGEAVSLKSESWALERVLNISRVFEDLYSSGKYRSNKTIDRDASLEERDRTLGQNAYRMPDFNIIYVYRASTLEDAEDAQAVAHDAYDAKGLEPREVKGTKQLLRVICSSSGINFM